MCGLRGEDHGLLARLTILANSVHISIKLMKGCVRQPRLIKEQGVYLSVQHLLECFHVIQYTIVSTLSDG